ncbi:glycine cleavage system protein H [Rhodococcus sp. T2V]|uniref:glycine cleavage system protein H n=1 Tax=Rhodococcus sp. T2V TaxID=3034164 RepID=UPI0023E32096|nr:glycine cleavage system protein H [Rhodococcus sp. T2V]MDF3304183.1 glycine cleavage system protein H [Rhodococcus sp. T2V]
MRARQIPSDRRFTATHSWVALAPGQHFSDFPLRAGVTDTALDDVEVVRLDLPAVRSTIEAGAPCALVWTSARSALTVYAPISGLVTMTNADAAENPQLVADDPFHRGWLFAVLPSPTSSAYGLLTPAQYATELSEAV